MKFHKKSLMVSCLKQACQVKIYFLDAYSYTCQQYMAMLFASKRNMHNIFWPLLTKLVVFLAK